MQTTMTLLLWFSLSVFSGMSGQGKTLDDEMGVGNFLIAFEDANSLDQPIVTDLQMVCFSLDATLNVLDAAFAPFAALFLLLAATLIAGGRGFAQMVVVTCFGRAPSLLLLRFVNTPSFMISLHWMRVTGFGACSGMVCCLFFLVSTVLLLGLGLLLRVLVICWSRLLVLTLLGFPLSGRWLMSFVEMRGD